MQYISKIYAARFFWTHLVFADLRSRWRRSFFGALWSFLQPLGITLLLSFVLGRVFKVEFAHYAPYILSGIVVWDFIMANTTGGAYSFIQADAYIKQCKHPLAIYTLRTVLSNLIVFCIAGMSLILWVLIVYPQHFHLSWFAAFTVLPILIIIAWPWATLWAYATVRFRDIPHMVGLLMQAVWFISPVYFEAKLFREGGLNWLVDYNPIYHILSLIRRPFLEGQWPTLENYAFSICTAGVLLLVTLFIGYRFERKVIFYL